MLWPVAHEHAEYATRELLDDEPDEDTMQIASEAAIRAMHDWDPALYALSTHVNMAVQGDVRKYLQSRQTGGIGSRRTVDDGNVAEFISLQDANGMEDEDANQPGTIGDELVYEEDAPQGYGDIGLELQRENADEAIALLLSGRKAKEKRMLLALHGEGVTLRDYAKQTGKPFQTIHDRNRAAIKNLGQKQKTWLMRGMGTANQRHPGIWNDRVSPSQGNPIWREATGTVYADWVWKPTLADRVQIETAKRDWKKHLADYYMKQRDAHGRFIVRAA